MGAGEFEAALGDTTGRAESLGTTLTRRRTEMEAVGREVGDSWGGESGQAAVVRLRRIAGTVDDLGARLHQVGQVLRFEGRAFVEALTRAELTEPRGADQRTAEGPEIDRHLRAAEDVRQADRVLADRLRGLLHDPVTSPVAVAALSAVHGPRGEGVVGATGPRVREFVSMLHRDAGAESLATAWHLLGPGERRALERTMPELGTAEGVPAADRDRINRRALAAHLDTLSRTDDVAAARLRSLHEALADDPELMLLNWTDDGRGSVSRGNPDTADFVHVHVPGTGADLQQVGTGLRRATAVCDELDELGESSESTSASAGDTTCASVLFQDYEPPANLVDAATSPMRQGLAALDEVLPGPSSGIVNPFADGVSELGTALDGLGVARDQHGNADARVLTSGFSAGSRIVSGAAADEAGIRADAIAVVGSPGLGRDPLDGLSFATPSGAEPVKREDFASVFSVVDPITYVGSPLGYGVRADSLFNGGKLEAVWDQSPWPWDFAANHGRLLDDGSEANQILAALLRGR